MKKQVKVFGLITAVFAAFIFGFFFGRNLNRTPVQIQSLPSITRPAPADTAPSESSGPTEPVIIDINTATAEDFEDLPGIGPVLAQRIVDYRQANGPFTTPGELLYVEGIGEGILESIWDLITVGG